MEKQYTEKEKAEIQSGEDRELENAVKLLQNSGKKESEEKGNAARDIREIFQRAFLNIRKIRRQKINLLFICDADRCEWFGRLFYNRVFSRDLSRISRSRYSYVQCI